MTRRILTEVGGDSHDVATTLGRAYAQASTLWYPVGSIPTEKAVHPDIAREIEKNLRRCKYYKRIDDLLDLARVKSMGTKKEGYAYRTEILGRPEAIATIIGGAMETIAEELKAINDEAKESKKILENLFNDAVVLRNKISPLMRDYIAEIRSTRMTIIQEVQTTLAAMRDIRKFFLESDHSEEIKRLDNFISLCQAMKGLKQDGTLDAIGDTVLNLAIKEEERKHEGKKTT